MIKIDTINKLTRTYCCFGNERLLLVAKSGSSLHVFTLTKKVFGSQALQSNCCTSLGPFQKTRTLAETLVWRKVIWMLKYELKQGNVRQDQNYLKWNWDGWKALHISVVRGKDVMDHEWDDPQLLPWPERFASLRLASISFKNWTGEIFEPIWEFLTILMYVNVDVHLFVILLCYTFMFSPFFIDISFLAFWNSHRMQRIRPRSWTGGAHNELLRTHLFSTEYFDTLVLLANAACKLLAAISVDLIRSLTMWL